MKQVTLVSATFGSIDVVVRENPNYPNTFEIGNKRIDFSEVLPLDVNLHKLEDYSIVIWDGVKAYVHINIGPITYTGNIDITSPKHEELFCI